MTHKSRSRGRRILIGSNGPNGPDKTPQYLPIAANPAKRSLGDSGICGKYASAALSVGVLALTRLFPAADADASHLGEELTPKTLADSASVRRSESASRT